MTGSNAGVAQLVEHQPSKLNVAGSSLVSRSTKTFDPYPGTREYSKKPL
jgi:hypothetical protein